MRSRWCYYAVRVHAPVVLCNEIMGQSARDSATRAFASVLLLLARSYELVLAINWDSSEPELFKAYRKLLLKVHPDKGGKGLFWNACWILQRRGLGRGSARSQPALQDRFRNKISHKFHTKISHDFSGGAAVVTSCGMVPDSVRDTRSFDFSGLPRHAPETSGKRCLLGPFWDLFGTLPRPCLGAV